MLGEWSRKSPSAGLIRLAYTLDTNAILVLIQLKDDAKAISLLREIIGTERTIYISQ
jgi:hypothetical protein